MDFGNLLPTGRPRQIDGISAVLLPFHANGKPNLDELAQNISHTTAAGLTPAVNMDTGYVNLITPSQRLEILKLATSLCPRFVAGAFVQGTLGDPNTEFLNSLQEIQEHGGVPVTFPCDWLKELSDSDTVRAFEGFANYAPEYIGFELGEMFVPFGRIYSLEVFRDLIQIPQMSGLKHSSLRRDFEWARLRVRDEVRPDFRVYTGNDLAIDMVMWGSDYLLGLSAFHPEAFSTRDRWWTQGDFRFFELNDALQYLGAFAFRPPVPA